MNAEHRPEIAREPAPAPARVPLSEALRAMTGAAGVRVRLVRAERRDRAPL